MQIKKKEKGKKSTNKYYWVYYLSLSSLPLLRLPWWLYLPPVLEGPRSAGEVCAVWLQTFVPERGGQRSSGMRQHTAPAARVDKQHYNQSKVETKNSDFRCLLIVTILMV